jgi:hypothetical protein
LTATIPFNGQLQELGFENHEDFTSLKEQIEEAK